MNNSTHTLVLFDHDGTTCQTNDNAYDSLKYCIRESAKICKLDVTPIESNWDTFFHETRGTTERYGARVIFNRIGNNSVTFEDFEKIYYQARANWYKNMKSYNEYTYDTYYPDAENLIFHCWKTPNTHIGLVTGNPDQTMKERLASHLQELFFSEPNLNTFGNEANSRQELIKLSIQKAIDSIPNFEPKRDGNDLITNVIYIGDSRADLFAGMLARVKTIWIPSRMLQTVKDCKGEDAIQVISELMPNSIHITNSLEREEVLQFINN